MSSVQYDLDTSGGLMPKIRALIAPPVLVEPPKKKKEKERKSRRTVNHDYCNSCKEGGDLLCCDRCPAAFHFNCQDPPLSDDKLPSGEWVCNRCKAASKVDKFDFEGHEETLKPLNTMIVAASKMNPLQFSLPKEMSCRVTLQGSSRRIRGKESKKKTFFTFDSGLTNLPTKLCFICSKSCRFGPLVQCDFCPLLFHFDCVNPPLIGRPAMKWMCPNHVEHFIDRNLLNTISLTDRVKLYDKYCGPISQDAIKTQFLHKIGRVNPPFREKVKLPGRVCICVPESVIQQTHRPPPLLPTLKTALTPASVRQSVASSLNSAYEKNQFLTQIVAFQTSVSRYIANIESGNMEQNLAILAGDNAAKPKGRAEICRASYKSSSYRGRKNFKSTTSTKSSHSKTSSSSVRALQRKLNIHEKGSKNQSSSIGSSQSASHSTNMQINSPNFQISDMKLLDKNLVYLLAFQRLQQLSPKDIQIVPKELPARASLCALDATNHPPVTMCYRSFHLGLGSAVDLSFFSFKHCDYVSVKHASIFYDEYSKQYELLNYSYHGTVVDGILYAPDGIGGLSLPEQPSSLDKPPKKRVIKQERFMENPPADESGPSTSEEKDKLPRRCQCPASCVDIFGGKPMEGAAILQHGSVIQCGCLRFVFAITEHGSRLQAQGRFATPKREPIWEDYHDDYIFHDESPVKVKLEKF